jgi:hypothetical protein
MGQLAVVLRKSDVGCSIDLQQIPYAGNNACEYRFVYLRVLYAMDGCAALHAEKCWC